MSNWKQIDRDSIEERARNGESARSIAKDIGVAIATVTAELRRRGITPGFPTMYHGTRAAHDWEQIICDHMSGMGKREIQKTYHVSPNVLSRKLRDLGIKSWPQGHKGEAKSPMNVPTNPALIGYIAGLIDGEGTIMVYDRERYHSVRIMIYNTSVELMDWLASNGGIVAWGSERYSKDGFNRKSQGRWGCYDAQSQHKLLCAVMPYLIIKRERAMKAIRMLERIHPLSPYNEPEYPPADRGDVDLHATFSRELTA